jgi:Uncharacterized conserved protein
LKIFSGEARINEVDQYIRSVHALADELETTIQVFDAKYIVSREHLRCAVELADRALSRGTNVADDRAVEILLFAAGRRQITDALELGVHAGTDEVILLLDPVPEIAAKTIIERGLIENLTEVTYDQQLVQSFYNINDAEMSVVDGDIESLVRERVALLVIER